MAQPISNTVSVANGASTLDLGCPSASYAGTTTVQLVAGTPVGLSVTVQGRTTGTTLAFTPIPYRRRTLIATASDDTVVSAALTDSCLIKIDSTGLDIRLNVTAFTSGTLMVGYRHSLGTDS